MGKRFEQVHQQRRMMSMHVRGYSTSLVIKEMLNKTRVTMTLSLEWLKSKRLSTKCSQEIWGYGSSQRLLANARQYQPLWKTVYHFLINIHSPLDLNILLSNIYSRETKKICPHKDLCSNVYSICS